MIGAIASLLALLSQGTVAGRTPPAGPARTEVPFEAARIVGRPSASTRHALLAGKPAVPAGGIVFTARCMVGRRDGRAFNCAAAEAPEAWRSTAIGLASFYRFDLDGLQPDPDERALAVTITDRIAPGDARPPERLFRFTAAAAGNVVFLSGFESKFDTYYPVAALRASEQALIQVDCQVQPDLTLFCLNAQLAPGSPPTAYVAAFQLATYQILGSARVAPALDNGDPAAGTIFRRTLSFRIPAE